MKKIETIPLRDILKFEIDNLDENAPHLFFAQATDFAKRILKSILKMNTEYTLEEYLVRIEAHGLMPIEDYEKLKILVLIIEHYRYGKNQYNKEGILKIKQGFKEIVDRIELYCDQTFFANTFNVNQHRHTKTMNLEKNTFERDLLSTEKMIEKMLSTEEKDAENENKSIAEVYETITSFPLEKMHKFEFEAGELNHHIWNLHIKHSLIKDKSHEDIIKHYSKFGAETQHVKYLIKVNNDAMNKIKAIKLSTDLIDLVIFVSLLALRGKTTSQAREILLKKGFDLKEINFMIDEVYPRQNHSPVHHH